MEGKRTRVDTVEEHEGRGIGAGTDGVLGNRLVEFIAGPARTLSKDGGPKATRHHLNDFQSIVAVLPEIVSGLTLDIASWTYNDFLPLRVTEQLEFQVTEFFYNLAHLPPIPYEGVGPVLESGERSYTRSIPKYTANVNFETNSFMSEEGRRRVLLQIEQLARSFQHQIAMSVISAVVFSLKNRQVMHRMTRDLRNVNSFARLERGAMDAFPGAKKDGGLVDLIYRSLAVFSSKTGGRKPNLLLIDTADLGQLVGGDGTAHTLVSYSEAGPAGPAARKTVATDVATFAGMRVVNPPDPANTLSDLHQLGSPLARQVAFGDYVLMTPYQRFSGDAPLGPNSSNLDVKVLDDVRGVWTLIKYLEAFDVAWPGDMEEVAVTVPADALARFNNAFPDVGIEDPVVTRADMRERVVAGRPIPFDVVLVRHAKEYTTRSIGLLLGGAETGFTAYGYAHAISGTQANNDTNVIAFSSHFGPVITNSNNILIVPDVVCAAKHGGSGARLFTPQEWREYVSNEFHPSGGLMRPSILPTLYPFGSQYDPRLLEISGLVPELEVRGVRPIAEFDGYYSFSNMPSSEAMVGVGQEHFVNTVLYPGACWTRTPGQEKFETYVHARGPFGAFETPESALLRAGQPGFISGSHMPSWVNA